MAGELVTAGAAFGPWGALAGGVAEVAMGAKGGSAAPSMADSLLRNASSFDNSGWTVNTGSGSASASASSGMDLPKWGIIGLVAFGLLVWFKKKN